MVPVKFKDLGKTTQDLFNKGFGFGEVKVEFNSKTAEGVELSTTHHKHNNSNDISGELEIKHAFNQTRLTHKWTTKNVLTETLAYDKLAEGLKAELQTTFSAVTCKPTAGKVSLDYQQPRLRMTVDADVMGGSTVVASAVYDMQGVVVGVEGGYSLGQGAVTKTGLALAYSQKDLAMVVTSDLRTVNATLHQVVNNRLQAAAQVTFDNNSRTSAFSILSQYTLDDGASFKAKLSHDGLLGVGYTTRLSPNAKLTLGLCMDSKDLNTDSQKVGIALCLNA